MSSSWAQLPANGPFARQSFESSSASLVQGDMASSGGASLAAAPMTATDAAGASILHHIGGSVSSFDGGASHNVYGPVGSPQCDGTSVVAAPVESFAPHGHQPVSIGDAVSAGATGVTASSHDGNSIGFSFDGASLEAMQFVPALSGRGDATAGGGASSVVFASASPDFGLPINSAPPTPASASHHLPGSPSAACATSSGDNIPLLDRTLLELLAPVDHVHCSIDAVIARSAKDRQAAGVNPAGNTAFSPSDRATQIFVGQLPATLSADALVATIDTVLGLHQVPKMVNMRYPPAGASQAAHALLTIDARYLHPVLALNRRCYFTSFALYYAPESKETARFQRAIAKAVAAFATQAPSPATAKPLRACVVVEQANKGRDDSSAGNAARMPPPHHRVHRTGGVGGGGRNSFSGSSAGSRHTTPHHQQHQGGGSFGRLPPSPTTAAAGAALPPAGAPPPPPSYTPVAAGGRQGAPLAPTALPPPAYTATTTGVAPLMPQQQPQQNYSTTGGNAQQQHPPPPHSSGNDALPTAMAVDANGVPGVLVFCPIPTVAPVGPQPSSPLTQGPPQ